MNTKIELDKDKLIELYINQNLELKEIAKILEIHPYTLQRKLKELNIKKETRGHKDNTVTFINKSKAKYGDLYDYSKVKYINSETPVVLIKKDCGHEFSITPHRHLKGNNCPICWKEKKHA